MPQSKAKKNEGLASEKSTKTGKVSKTEREIEQANKLLTHRRDMPDSEAGKQALAEYNKSGSNIDLTSIRKLSIDKHIENTRFKIVYTVDKLADELMREASKKSKRDKEYLKGLVWSFGTLYDKLNAVQSDAQAVALPSKLLANVTQMIKAQTELIKQSRLSSSSKANRNSDSGQGPIDVTPSEATLSSSPSVEPATQQEPSEDYVDDKVDSNST